MEIIHANHEFEDLQQLRKITSYDIVLSDSSDSDFLLIAPLKSFVVHPANIGDIIYCPNGEIGGVISRRIIEGERIDVYGKTWRGMLNKNLIYPTPGQAYRSVSGNAKTVIEGLLGNHFGTLFTVAPSSVTLADQFRYEPIGDGIHRMVSKAGAKLVIRQKDSGVELSIVPREDLSESIELSEDYGALVKIDEDQSQNTNHVVALGQGELLDRRVIQAWLLPDGTITYDETHPQRPRGVDEHTHKLDYPNAEDDQTLIEAIRRVFSRQKASINTSIDLSNATEIEGDLGDIIATRERTTGIYVTQRISKKIIKVHDTGRVVIRYEAQGV